MTRILIMGLPGSGKTTLAKQLHSRIDCKWYNADEMRKLENNWDFSMKGRILQANKMKTLAENAVSAGFKYVICDFVAPTEEIRHIFNADITIWMNTIKESRYTDTNRIFQKPKNVDYIISDFNYNIESVLEHISNKIKP